MQITLIFFQGGEVTMTLGHNRYKASRNPTGTNLSKLW